MTGCVNLEGNISLVLSERPSSNDFTVSLINYNCNETLDISDSQIDLKPDYKDSKCDKINTQINNNPNSLSLSISSSLGSNCGKSISTGIIIAIVFGAVGVSIIVALTIYGLLKLRKKRTMDRLKSVENEMQMR